MSEFTHSNRLINEKSPYLRTHANSPVDWFPWGKEACELSKNSGKPIFLSVGYSASKWCHIMLEESFSNPQIAALMNENFINVKVDKLELPYLASMYMEFANIISGIEGSGWPLNILLTPSLTPFLAFHYVPLESKFGMPGMNQLVSRVCEMWKSVEEREILEDQAGKLLEVLNFVEKCETEGIEADISYSVLENAVDILYKEMDVSFGGIRAFPKKSIGVQGEFLLQYSVSKNEQRTLFYLNRSLKGIMHGGIRDHLTGGFCNYSLDEEWMVPCFEKSLIENLMLGLTYLKTFAVVGNEAFRDVGLEIFEYVESELKDKGEDFFISSDELMVNGNSYSDSYTWTRPDIENIVGMDADLFCLYFGVGDESIIPGRTILHTSPDVSVKDLSEMFCSSDKDIEEKLRVMKHKLLDYRKQSANKSYKDDTAFSYCNGFAIYAYCNAGILSNNKHYIDVAEKVAIFVRESLIKDGVLYRCYRNGDVRFDACLEDYACVAYGFISLFEAGRGASWLKIAIKLIEEVILFFKSENGAFYSNNGRDSSVIIRRCEFSEEDILSGNAVLAQCYDKLFNILEDNKYANLCKGIVNAANHVIIFNPLHHFGLLSVYHKFLDKNSLRCVIAYSKEEDKQAIIDSMQYTYMLNITLIWLKDDDNDIREIVSSFNKMRSEHGYPKLYATKGHTTSFYVIGLDRIIATIKDAL